MNLCRVLEGLVICNYSMNPNEVVMCNYIYTKSIFTFLDDASTTRQYFFLFDQRGPLTNSNRRVASSDVIGQGSQVQNHVVLHEKGLQFSKGGLSSAPLHEKPID